LLVGNPDIGPIEKTLKLSINGGPEITYLFDTTGHSRTATGWFLETFSFIGTGSDTIQSRSAAPAGGYGQAAYGPAIDDESVTAVHEPSTWAMMIIGFMAYRARRNRPSESTDPCPGQPIGRLFAEARKPVS
jgi:hypothetical protein